jgi:hypothetical protein
MLYETDAGDLIDFAKRWAELGDAVSEQVEQVVDDPETDEVNPAAIELARSRLRGLNEGLDQALDGYLTRHREEGS